LLSLFFFCLLGYTSRQDHPFELPVILMFLSVMPVHGEEGWHINVPRNKLIYKIDNYKVEVFYLPPTPSLTWNRSSTSNIRKSNIRYFHCGSFVWPIVIEHINYHCAYMSVFFSVFLCFVIIPPTLSPSLPFHPLSTTNLQSLRQ
jgi:hypothetical protein